MFFGIILLCIVYYYLNSRNKEKKVEIVEENLEFIPSDTFRGAKKGYVFKNGDMGIGYYIDNNIQLIYMANKPVNMNDLRDAIAKLEFKPTISNESLMSIQSTDSTTNPLDEAWNSKNKRKRPMSSSELRDSIPLSDSSDDDDIKAELKRITPKKIRKVTVRKGGKRRKKRTRKKRRKKKTKKRRIKKKKKTKRRR